MPTEKYFRSIIVLNYTKIIKEYFHMMNNSNTIKSLNNPIPTMVVGINAVNKVFEYILLKSKNSNHAYFYSQKCCCYYLEYIEQIYNNDLSNTLNIMDAIMFVYKKTIFDAFDGDNFEQSNEPSNTMSNIISLSNRDIVLNEGEIASLLQKCNNIIKILFFWDNNNITTENRMKICNEYLERYFKRIDTTNDIYIYLELIQQKSNMDFLKYFDLLHEFIYKLENSRKYKTICDDMRDECLLKFYIEEDTFHEKINQGQMKELVNWLLV
uniref:Uncharacterized protein n=1 Tax=viral metagenome TaxID=1070528 RepID=A0A6C0DUM7_9ZZZZ